jgi:hypothetical protein
VLPQGWRRWQAPLVDRPMPTDPFHLDPDKFPKRLDLDLSEEVYERLLALSRKSGRSIQEIVEQILCASVTDLAAEEDP